jgi:hypothetical protein
MSTLLDTVIEAHGGLDRWNQLDAISAHLAQGGALWTSKGQEGVIADDPAAILGGTKTYIRDFDRSLAGSHSAQALVDTMMDLHGDLGNPYTLWTAAQSVFEQGQGASA